MVSRSNKIHPTLTGPNVRSKVLKVHSCTLISSCKDIESHCRFENTSAHGFPFEWRPVLILDLKTSLCWALDGIDSFHWFRTRSKLTNTEGNCCFIVTFYMQWRCAKISTEFCSKHTCYHVCMLKNCFWGCFLAQRITTLARKIGWSSPWGTAATHRGSVYRNSEMFASAIRRLELHM